jgi:predicted nucleotidyltransferase
MFENTNLTWLKTNTILLVYGGSTAYGTDINNEEYKSDVDLRGFAIPPGNYFYGLENFEAYHSPEGAKTDIVIYSLQKYTHLALQNNPNVLEILFTKPEHLMMWTDFGQELINIRHQFLSKQFFMRTNGYAKGQYHEMIQNGGKPTHGQGNPVRMANREKYGYDTKAASHLIRLMNEGIEVLETGNLTVYRPERELLIDIKLGKYKFEEVMEMYRELDKKLYDAYKNSKLPEKPNFDKINKFTIELTKKFLRKYNYE